MRSSKYMLVHKYLFSAVKNERASQGSITGGKEEKNRALSRHLGCSLQGAEVSTALSRDHVKQRITFHLENTIISSQYCYETWLIF